MKISRNWLQEYIDFSGISNEDYFDYINTRVAEIEEMYEVARPLEHATIVKISKIEKHPNRDNLKLVTIETGSGNIKVVCGANNVELNAYAVYLPVGAVVRKHGHVAEEEHLIKIDKKEIHGIASEGILCSESELGIGSSHDGLFICTKENLCSDFKAGDKLSSYLEGPDLIIDIDNKSLTHRPDLWSHFGFARELSAIFKKPLKLDYDNVVGYNKWIPDDLKDIKPKRFTNSILDPDTCLRFTLLEVSNVSNSESPAWLKRRLFSIAAGVRNILVDASNYALNDVGQPNHAFDSKLLRGNKLYARKANVGESFTALDEIHRNFTTEDLVIADEEGPLDLAGVIGGKSFSVQADTSHITMVSSTFDAVAIRKTCKRQHVRTDSSSRYEKSLSPYQATLSFLSYLSVLKRSGQNPIVEGFCDAPEYTKPEKIKVEYSHSNIKSRLQGVPETDQEIDAILKALKFEVFDGYVEVPYFRATKDISIPADLVEEVGRSIGYARVPETAPLITSSGSQRNVILTTEREIGKSLQGMGYSEVYNYTFSSSERMKQLGYDTSDCIELLNSVDTTLSSVRTTLIPGMLEVAEKNYKYSESFSVFEVGRTYHKNTSSEPIERRLLSIMNVDSRNNDKVENPLSQNGRQFYAIVNSIKKLTRILNCKDVQIKPLVISPDKRPANFLGIKDWMHPYRCAYLSVGELACGIISEVRPSFLSNKSSRVVIAEIDIQAIFAAKKTEILFKKLPKFPSSFFEISLVADRNEMYSDIVSKLKANIKSNDFLTSIQPVSVFEGGSVRENMKSISLKFVFSKSEDTITSSELESLRSDILKAVSISGYELRS